jgi:DGQHR domain-containing protein
MSTAGSQYETITVRSLRVIQTGSIPLYSFFLSGSDLLRLADLSRMNRSDDGKVVGFQRPEVLRHVAEIQQYLDSEHVLFPNGIILAISDRVKFLKSRGPGNGPSEIAEAGHLELPLAMGIDVPRVAWVVDGQQRCLALSRCNKPHLPVPVCAFVSEDVTLHRDQFVRINQGRPLPKRLIDELLPEYDAILPTRLAPRKIPSLLVNWLNTEAKSPFHGIIKRMTNQLEESGSDAVVNDNALLEGIKFSLESEHGCLSQHRNHLTGEVDTKAICHTLQVYWSSVKLVFPDAWGLPPRRSRLMHTVGIRAMSALMDAIMVNIEARSTKATDAVATQLRLISERCAWTSGEWADGYAWNAFQATPTDIKKLSGHLMNLYYQTRGGQA